MTWMEEIVLTLETDSESWAGTDDHVFLSIVGTAGGREFNLDVENFDDHKEGSTVIYTIGDSFIPEKVPKTAPAKLTDFPVHLENITHVYLRKDGFHSEHVDDLWHMKSAQVTVSAGGGTKARSFKTTGGIKLAFEHGLQVWFAELAPGGKYVDSRLENKGTIP